MGGKTSRPKDEEEELANVYIFNRIENNKADIELIRSTFESLMCVVTEIEGQNKTYKELQNVVKKIVEGNFKDFKYVVIFILDNENYEEHIWVTEDEKDFHLNGNLMTAICANKSLERKLRFFILQTNRVPSEKIKFRKRSSINCCKKYYSGKDLRYFATSSGCVLNHKWVEGETSPFIRLLCDGIYQNVRLPLADQLPIDELLNKISQEQTDECPSIIPLFEPYVLGNAK